MTPREAYAVLDRRLARLRTVLSGATAPHEASEIVVATHVGWEELGERAVVVDLRSGDFLVFAHLERDIWRAVARGEALTMIAEQIAAAHGVSRAVAMADVDAFVVALEDAGLVTRVRSTRAPGSGVVP